MKARGVRRLTLVATLISVAMVGGAATVAAGQPNGLKGYEGQPGNQGGQHHGGKKGQPNGLKGYEGQPGNQGGSNHHP